MLKNQRYTPLLLLVLAVIAVVVLATGLSHITFDAAERFPFGAFLRPFERPDIAPLGDSAGGNGERATMLAVLFFWFGLIVTLLYATLTKDGRKQMLRSLPYLIAIMLIVYALSRIQPKEGQPPPQETAAGGMLPLAESLPAAPDFVANPPQWFLLGVSLLLVTIFVGMVWFFWRYLRSQREEEDSQERIIRQVERTLTDLEGGMELKNAIIRCYAEMSQVLQEGQNIRRSRGMTPREFETQLARVGIGDEHIQRLTRLFESVRYGSKALGGRQEREAADCLRAIVRTYGKTS